MSIRPCNPRVSARRTDERRLRVIALACAALAAPAAHALSSDRDQPMDVKADYSRIVQASDRQPGTTFLKGNVVVVRGTMRANAAEATIHQNAAGDIQHVVMTGQQAHMQQQQDGGGLMTADADKIDFDNDTSVAVLTGNVKVVQQGRGEFHGTKMTYNTNTGEMESGDNTPANRVHMIIQPKARPAEMPAKPADATEKAAPTGPASDRH